MLTVKQDEPQLYLASTSPRRRELLRQLGVIFQTLPVDIDESCLSHEHASDYVRRMALEKARAGQRSLGDHSIPVLGSDTAVVLADEIFGKPTSRQHAVDMLSALSGKTHEVLTSVAVVNSEQEKVCLHTSQVTFKSLSEEEIVQYWETGEPADKAGAYAIQGKAGRFITHMSGSFSAVMGLPLYETAELLAEFDVRV